MDAIPNFEQVHTAHTLSIEYTKLCLMLSDLIENSLQCKDLQLGFRVFSPVMMQTSNCISLQHYWNSFDIQDPSKLHRAKGKSGTRQKK